MNPESLTNPAPTFHYAEWRARYLAGLILAAREHDEHHVVNVLRLTLAEALANIRRAKVEMN